MVKRANSLRNAFNQITEQHTLAKNALLYQHDQTPPSRQKKIQLRLKKCSRRASPSSQRIRINELIVQERYAEANQLIRDIIKNTNQQQNALARVEKAYLDRRDAVQLEVMRANNLFLVQEALKTPRANWGLEGVQEWADNLERARADSLGVAVTTPKEDGSADTTPAVPEVQAPTTLGGIERSTLRTREKIVNALLSQKPDDARRVIGNVDDAGTRTILDRELSLWEKSRDIMGTAFTERSVRHRVSTPYGTDLWDVVGFEDAGLTLRAPGGSRSTLPWRQVKPNDLAALYSAIANSPNATPEEQAIASLFNMHQGSYGAANLHLNRARKEIIPTHATSKSLRTWTNLRRLKPRSPPANKP